MCVRAVKRIVEDIRRVELRVARGEKLVDVLRPPNARKVLREGPDDAWVHPPVIDLGLSSVEIQEATERAR